jgi:membrane fusion protein (multidrug efflux system)
MPIEPNPTEVTQARVVKTAPPVVEFTGVITSPRSTVISAQVQGRIEQFNVHAGQLVKAGELVAKLDETELQTKVDQTRSQEQSAQMEAGAYGAQASALRKKMVAESRLHQLGVAPGMAVITARADYAQAGSQGGAAMARALAARAAREQSEKDLARAKIFAPIDGVITGIKAHKGEVAMVGTALARVFDPNDLIIRFAVPKEHRSEIRLGQRIELTIDGNQRLVRGTVTSISGAQEPPINFTVVEADIDDTKLAPEELSASSIGRVRIAEARGAKR